ncbi:hypothetical protein IIA16_02035 [bacterium]|nr:hypothetical protein [bacterium]
MRRWLPHLLATLVVIGVVVAAMGMDGSPLATIQARRWFAREYGVAIRTGSESLPERIPVTGSDLQSGDLQAILPILQREISLYPSGLVKAAVLRRLVFVRDLRWDNIELPAILTGDGGLIFEADRGKFPCSYLVRLFHHEFYHQWENRVWHWPDEEAWSALNPSGFEYNSDSWLEAYLNPAVGRSRSSYSDRSPGILSGYSEYSAAEDRAEYFAFLMTSPEVVWERMNMDPFADAKARALMRALWKSVPEMTDDYWRGVVESRREQGANGWCAGTAE